MSSIISYIVT